MSRSILMLGLAGLQAGGATETLVDRGRVYGACLMQAPRQMTYEYLRASVEPRSPARLPAIDRRLHRPQKRTWW
jgi:hypothetical protein